MNYKLDDIKEWYGLFLSQYKTIVGQDIKEWDKIEELVRFFAQSKIGCLVDFIDSSWWDHVESMEFDESCRLIHLTYNTIDPNLPKDDLNVLFSVFGAHRICGDFFVDSVRIVPVNEFPVLLMKTQYKNQKQINQLYNSKCQKCKIHKYKTFSVEIARIRSENKTKMLERTILPNVNCFTIAFFPKAFGRKITELESEKNLLNVNEKEIDKFFEDALSKISELNDKKADVEDVKDYGNRIRRHFENHLKVLRIRNDHYLRAGEDDCQKLMLGSLVSELMVKEVPSKVMKIEDVVQKLNECSHDSGVDVSVNDLLLVVASIIWLVNEDSLAVMKKEFSEKCSKEISEEEKELLRQKHLERNTFIIQNVPLWNFGDILTDEPTSTNIKFYFCLKENSFSFGADNAPGFYLSKNGKFVQYSVDCLDKDIPLEECYGISEREKLTEVVNDLKSKINKVLQENGFEPLGGISYDISVDFVMQKKPNHLFSKKELDQVVRNADDQVDNTLVIDEFGYAHIVQKDAILYPVRFEQWIHGNHYVGENVTDEYLKETYRFALSAFFLYLETGESQFADGDYVDGSDEEIETKIKALLETL